MKVSACRIFASFALFATLSSLATAQVTLNAVQAYCPPPSNDGNYLSGNLTSLNATDGDAYRIGSKWTGTIQNGAAEVIYDATNVTPTITGAFLNVDQVQW